MSGHLLILTPIFPHALSPTEGLFNEQQALALRRLGFQITVIVCKPWLPRNWAKTWKPYHSLAGLPAKEERGGILILYARYLHIPRYKWPQWTVSSCARAIREALRRHASDRDFEMIQVHSAWPAGLAAPAVADALSCPFVVTLHIQDDPQLTEDGEGSRLYRRMLKRASAVVAVGQPLVRSLKSWKNILNGKPVSQIPNGLDREAVIGAQKNSAGHGEKGGHIVSVGNLWPVKGIDLNLKAFALLDRRGVTWNRYTVIGDGGEQKKLRRLAAQLGVADRVDFTGRLEHAETLKAVARADIFSLPSWQEAFGVAYLEAMALGKPVIGCQGQGAEDIFHHEVEGLLVPPKDIESLAEALARLLENPGYARRLGQAGQARAQEFTWERNAAQYLELYKSLRQPQIIFKEPDSGISRAETYGTVKKVKVKSPGDNIFQFAAPAPQTIAKKFYALLRKEVVQGNPFLNRAEQKKLQSHYPIMMDAQHYPLELAASIYANRRAHPVQAVIDARDPMVFDAGCGFGTESFLFAALGARVIAVDLEPEQVAIARRRVRYYSEVLRMPLPIAFEVADLHEYRPPQGLSMTWLASVLAVIRNQEDFLGGIWAATLKGGRIFISDMNLANPLFAWNEWRRRRKAARQSPEFAKRANFWKMWWRAGRQGARYFPQKDGGFFDDVQFFSSETLKRTLQRIGFKPQAPDFYGFVPPGLIHSGFDGWEKRISRIPLIRGCGYFYVVAGLKP